MVGWLAVQPVVGENFNQKIWLVIIIYTVVVWSAAWRPGAGWFQMVSNGFRQIWFKVTYMEVVYNLPPVLKFSNKLLSIPFCDHLISFKNSFIIFTM